VAVNFRNDVVFKEIPATTRGLTAEFEDPFPLPITLSINQESRRETLNNQTVPFRGDSEQSGTKLVGRRFCYKLKLDQA
jgi:hypothetical protein